MADEHDGLDRELSELGARWREENPVDGEPGDLGFAGGDGFVDRDISRGTRWWGGLVAAAAVVAVVLGTVALLPDRDEAPPTSRPRPDVVNRLDCSKGSQAEVRGAPVVPQGAVAARLCGRISGDSGFDAAWPQDTLTGSAVDELVAAVNRLAPAGGTSGCGTALPSMPFDLVLGYGDGLRVSLQGGARVGCTELARGGSSWDGAVDVKGLVVRLIARQRAEAPPGEPIPPICPARFQNVAGTIGATAVSTTTPVAITACRYRIDGTERGSGGTLERQVVVERPDDLLGVALVPAGDRCVRQPLGVVQDLLVVRDGYGDIHVVPTTRCWTNDLAGVPANPSAALRAAVDEVLRLP